MSEMLDKLEINAESALDFDDTTLVVPMTLVREMFERLEEENAALKRRLLTSTTCGECDETMLDCTCPDTKSLLTAEESE